MIDVKLPLRKAYYTLLSGNIIYNSAPIPISSDIKKLTDSAAQTYIIMSGQSGSDQSTLSSFDSQEQIILDIVCKAQTRVNKETIDNIANQIFALVLPTPQGNGLPKQSGVVIECVQLINDKYLDLIINSGSTVNRRLLTFTQKVRQQ